MRTIGGLCLALAVLYLGYQRGQTYRTTKAFIVELKGFITDCREEIRYRHSDRILLLSKGKEKYPLLFSKTKDPLRDDFIKDLGISDVEGQIAHCTRYLEQINQKIAHFEETDAPKERLYYLLGVFGAATVIIMTV